MTATASRLATEGLRAEDDHQGDQEQIVTAQPALAHRRPAPARWRDFRTGAFPGLWRMRWPARPSGAVFQT